MYFISVFSLVTSSNRMLYPTSSPSSHPTSAATRAATLIAATRRGCVHPTRLAGTEIKLESASSAAAATAAEEEEFFLAGLVNPSSCRNCVSCVVFPEPVSPTTIVTWFSLISATSSSRQAATGRKARCCASVRVAAKRDWALADFMCERNWSFLFPFFFLPPPVSSSSSSSSSPSSSAAILAASASLSAAVRPVAAPIFEPATSQNRARDCAASRFRRISATSLEPERAMTARSEVGSLTGLSFFLTLSDKRMVRKGKREGGRKK